MLISSQIQIQCMSLVTCIKSPITTAEPHITSNQAQEDVSDDGANINDSDANDALPCKGQDKEKEVLDGRQAQVRFWSQRQIYKCLQEFVGCVITRLGLMGFNSAGGISRCFGNLSWREPSIVTNAQYSYGTVLTVMCADF